MVLTDSQDFHTSLSGDCTTSEAAMVVTIYVFDDYTNVNFNWEGLNLRRATTVVCLDTVSNTVARLYKHAFVMTLKQSDAPVSVDFTLWYTSSASWQNSVWPTVRPHVWKYL